MRKKRIILFVLSGALLLVVVVAGLIGILSKNSTASISETEPTKTEHPKQQQRQQPQDFNYPDPANQDALPDSVKVTSSDETVLLRVSVKEGHQIYECQPSTTDPSGFAWKFQAPFAFLKGDNGANVIHATGPSWLNTLDGSEVKAAVGEFTNPDGTVVSANATPDANSIPWLRLDITGYRGNNGLFSRVDQIQRLYTVGGKAPKDGCNQDAADKHLIQSVDYTAEYVFWGRKDQ